MARKNLSEIKMRDFQEYEKVCQKLADRKDGPEHNETVEEGGQEYRLSRKDVQHIKSLRGERTNRTSRDNRSRSVGRKGRLWLWRNVIVFAGAFVALLFLVGPLLELSLTYSRTIGGSLLWTAALLVWLRPVMERAAQHGGVWRAIFTDLRRNPLNPAMLASVGAGIMFVVDWWPFYGSNIGPDMVNLVKSIIHIVKSLGG